MELSYNQFVKNLRVCKQTIIGSNSKEQNNSIFSLSKGVSHLVKLFCREKSNSHHNFSFFHMKHVCKLFWSMRLQYKMNSFMLKKTSDSVSADEIRISSELIMQFIEMLSLVGVYQT